MFSTGTDKTPVLVSFTFEGTIHYEYTLYFTWRLNDFEREGSNYAKDIKVYKKGLINFYSYYSRESKK